MQMSVVLRGSILSFVSRSCHKRVSGWLTDLRTLHLVSALSHFALDSARYAFGTSDGSYPVMLTPLAWAKVKEPSSFTGIKLNTVKQNDKFRIKCLRMQRR